MSPDPSGRAMGAPRASRTAWRNLAVPVLQFWAPEIHTHAGRTLSSSGCRGPRQPALFGGKDMEKGLPCKELGSGNRSNLQIFPVLRCSLTYRVVRDSSPKTQPTVPSTWRFTVLSNQKYPEPPSKLPCINGGPKRAAGHHKQRRESS